MSYYCVLRLWFSACLALSAVACNGSPEHARDASSPMDGGGNDDDAQTIDGGILLRFVSAFSVPGSFDGEDQPALGSVSIDVENLRVIGDSASGDDRTTLAARAFSFANNPEIVAFPEAPVGNYSRLKGTIVRFAATGTCRHESVTRNWSIEDQALAGVEIDVRLRDVVVEPGTASTVSIDVRLDRPYDRVEWDEVSEQGGVLQVDSDYEHLDDLRESIEKIFGDD